MNKKNLPLILALCVPLVMIVLVAGAIYLPSIGKKPNYNFLYVSNTDYYNSDRYFVADHKLVVEEKIYRDYEMIKSPQTSKGNLYLYNIQTNTAQDVSLEEAQKYILDASKTSPDGYEVTRGSGGGGGFLFGGGYSDYNSYFIRGHNRALKLNLKTVGTYPDMQFIGWVITK
jgi:hypothetical protein